MRRQRDIRILLCADTHLGFDQPIRPRIERRRRGPDFFANFRRVLDRARQGRFDLVVHGGDLFFRSRVPGSIVDRVYRMLSEFAAHGIPLVIVPGNHERSVLPSSLFLSHPHIHVFDRPQTRVFDLAGARIAVAGFPCAREEIRRRFSRLVAETGLREAEAEVRLLCLHQAIEGARVGPSGYAFRRGEDVIPMADLPPEADAALAGHIHRRQVLIHRRPDGSPMPVVYPGSIERTSFAEKDEPKGYFDLTVGGPDPAGRRRLKHQFEPLPARPMEDVILEKGLDGRGAREFLRSSLSRLDPDSIVRLRCPEGLSPEARTILTAESLRRLCPPTMNVEFAGDRFPSRGRAGG